MRGGIALALILIDHFMGHTAINAQGFTGDKAGFFPVEQKGNGLGNIIRDTNTPGRMLLFVAFAMCGLCFGGGFFPVVNLNPGRFRYPGIFAVICTLFFI
tara:strand:- start:76544 stop:76843 length:300 start_codon:yes stop_codon:yes gene_type:complete